MQVDTEQNFMGMGGRMGGRMDDTLARDLSGSMHNTPFKSMKP